ncbi:TRAP transporter substrate-binding protein DctP [Microbacterium lushaniae]|nr:TRAP transporter substrate-binding protein DctP [Microbacterium lushaniae]
MSRTKKAVLATVVTGSLLAIAGCAGDTGADAETATDGYSTVTLKAVANSRSSLPFQAWEAFAEDLAERTDGAITVELTDMAELGFNGSEAISLVSDGLADMMEIIPGFVAGEQPLIEGVQLPGVFDGFDTSKSAWEAWSSGLDGLPESTGGHVLGSIGWECIYLWSDRDITDLADIQGMKVRAFGEAQSDIVRSLGAEPVSMPLADTYASMQRGVINGVITGATAGSDLSLGEVSSHLVDVNLGCTGALAVMNEPMWESLTDADRDAITASAEVFSETSWDIAREATEGGTVRAEEAGVVVVPVDSEWSSKLATMSQDVVVKNWAARSGEDAVAVFNENLATFAGFSIK